MGVGRTLCRQPGLAGFRNVGLWLPPFLSPVFFHTQVASHHRNHRIQPAPAPASPPLENLSPPASPAPSTSLTPSPPSTPAGGHVINSSSDTIMSSHKNNLPTILEDEIGKSNKENAANDQYQHQNGK